MLAKLKRSKSEMTKEPAPLRGMPLLKQMRSSQRTEALWPKLETGNGHPSLSEFDRTGIRCDAPEMKYIGAPPKEPKQIPPNHSRGSTAPNLQVNGLHPANGVRNTNGHVMNSPLPDVPPKNGMKKKQNGVDKKRKTSQKSSDSDKSQTRKSAEYTGRVLLSVKKERQANREMKVTSSMRALTPLERESILCLEEAFSNDQEWNFSSGEEDHVFERKSVSSSSTLGTNGNESDTSSVGSIIDLVGNLSDICVSSSSSPRSSEYASPLKSNQNNSNNQFSYQADAYHGVNDIIQNTRSTHVESKKAPKNKESQNRTIEDEPIYSVVDKSKKKANRKTQNAEENAAKPKSIAACDEGRIAEASNDEPTAKSSREFWNHLQSNGGSPKSPKHVGRDVKSVGVLMPAPEPIKLRHVENPCAKRPTNFVITPQPHKSPPPVAAKNVRPKISSKNQPVASANDANSACGQVGLKLDDNGNLPVAGHSPTTTVVSLGAERKKSTREATSQPVIAIPRQTTICNKNPTSPNRPFVVTPASRVISWS